MLFGSKKCHSCESEYDVASPTCPVCGTPEPGYEKRKIAPTIIWMDYWRQIVIFLVGSVGLSVVASIVASFVTESDFDLLMTNLVAYLTVLLVISFLIGKQIIKFKPHFATLLPFVAGAVGCLTLYLFSGFYGMIINSITTMTENTNEATADTFITTFPYIAFFVIVLLGPICEELTYRLGLFSFLYRVKPWAAYLISIILFGFIHFNAKAFTNTDILLNEFLNLPFYFFAGFLFCFMYHKWGLAASLTAHVLNNLLTFLLVLAGANS